MVTKGSPSNQPEEPALSRPSAASSDQPSIGSPSLSSARPRRDSAIFGFLLLLLLVIYNSNFRSVVTADSFPARLLPFSLLLNHNLYLDQWVQPLLAQPLGPHGVYFAVQSHGHWMSLYPIITPLVVTPLYVLPAWWISRQSPPLDPNSLIGNTMEKLSASLIAALSGALLFLALRRVASRHVSFGVALIYGLASNTWTISSQALWRHGLTELSFAFLLWALFRLPDSPSAPFWAGLGLAVATANKPLEAILVVAFLLYFFGRRQWKNLLLFLAPLVALGSLVVAYNLHFFARLLGAYPPPKVGAEVVARLPLLARLVALLPGSLASPNRGLLVYTLGAAFAFWGAARLWKEKSLRWNRPIIIALGSLVVAFILYLFVKLVVSSPISGPGAAGGAHLPLLVRRRVGLLGSLISPSHGLFVYTPWAAFAFWGASRLWKEKSPGWSRPLIVALVAVWVVQMAAGTWWGGWCFGPRYPTDLLPFLAWFLVPVWASIRTRPVLRVVFAATVAFALWVQVVGAFYYPAGNWNGSPVDVDQKPQRCWDWSDNQLRRSWRAGPAPPILLSEWKRLLQHRFGVRQP